jgi:two-component system LytT family response regulator
MTKLRILIVDDEAVARERLLSFLCDESSVDIEGECGDGIEAVAAIRQRAPDIVFLDVQIPGIDGLRVMRELPTDHRPSIILVTAHDRFAVDAFTMQVVDYLLKPFDRERFQFALKRAMDEVLSRRAGDLEARFERVLATHRTPNHGRLVFKADGRQIFLRPDDIVWAEAESNYSLLHLVGPKHLMIRETLSSLQRRLSSSHFVRVNRSALVNADQVQELQTNNNGDHVVLLRSGVHLPLSRQLRGHAENFV